MATHSSVFLPGEFHGQRSLVGYSPWVHKEQTPLSIVQGNNSARSCCCCVAAGVSDSVRPQRRQPARLPRPRDSPGKNTGVGCHCLLQCMKAKSESEVAQSCPTLSDPLGCSPPGSSVHGIFQARVPEWGAIAFSNRLLVESKIQITELVKTE